MKQVKSGIPKNLQKGIPLKVRPGHTVRLEVTDEPLTVHTGLSLFYAMAETLEIPRILDEQVKVKERESGYPESEHILALAANAFIGGDYLDDLEALREDVAIQKALGHILQLNRAFAEIEREVSKRRREKITAWTMDVDAKGQEVYGAQKEGAAKSYNGIYSLQTMYTFVDETEELLHSELRSGNTHPGGKAVAYLRRMERKIPPEVVEVKLRSDSALYNKAVVEFCEKRGWHFSITADQTSALMKKVEALSGKDWQEDPKDSSLAYGEFRYQPTHWPKDYRFLVRREKKEPKGGQGVLFAPLAYSYYVVVTDREGEIKTLLEFHDRKGAAERRIGQFSSEFLHHLPLGNFMANWVYMLCAQLAYNLSYWLRDLVLPPFYRKKHIKRIRRCVGLVAAKVTHGGHQIRLKISVLHRWWRDFVYAWRRIPALGVAIGGG
jgi:hypothetical protein